MACNFLLDRGKDDSISHVSTDVLERGGLAATMMTPLMVWRGMASISHDSTDVLEGVAGCEWALGTEVVEIWRGVLEALGTSTAATLTVGFRP